MATQKLAKVVITANASTAKKVLEEIDNLVQKYTADIQKMTAAGQANTAECKRAESTLKALSQVQRDNIEDTKRLSEVVQDLTNTKLRDLRRAMGSGKSALAKLTGSDADLKKAEQIRSEMKQVGDQMRLIEGQYVKIADGLKNVKNQSDQWLDKAIKQQRDLVGSLQKSDASYQQNLATLKQLEAEEDRRKGKMGVAEAHQTVTSQNASASDLRRAKSTLTEARDNTPTGNSADIAKYNSELQEIEKRLEAVSGKTQKASMSWKQMKQVLAEPNKASGEDIKRTMEVIQQKIQQLPAGSKYVADLRRQYSMLEQTLKGTRMSQSALNDILARSKQGKASLDELRRAYKQLEEELNQINTKSKEFADKQKSMKELKKNIDEATGAVNKHGSAWQTALKNLTAYVGLFAVFNKAKELVTGVIQKNLDMSDSLANIRKVSGLLHQDIDKMAVSLSKIDTRTPVSELQKIAYAGAKLGIGNYGVEGLESFVKAANQVNVALKEDLGDEALTALSKITEVMGLIPKMGVEQSMLKTGSAIFKLASTSTATSNKIIDFSNRLLAMGKVGALSTSDILALGAAVDSMAIEPEVASTAFTKLITEIRKGTSSIEKDLGLAKGTLKSFLEEGRGIEAIQTIFHKMHESGNVFALDSLFKDLGSDGSRLIKVMVTMAEKADMLDKAVSTSRQAFDEGMAVTQEYNIQQDTAKGILERANNMWNKSFVNPDGINSVKQLSIAWYDLSRALTTSSASQKAVLGTIDLIVLFCKTLIALLPTLVGFFIGKGIAMAAIQLVNISKAVWAWVIAQKALNLAMSANAFGLAIGVLSTLYSYFQKNANAAQDAADAADHFSKSLAGAKFEVGRATVELDGYKRAIDGAKKGTKERQAAIDQFNSKFGSYLSKLITEKSTAKDLAKAYNEAATAIERKVMAQALEKDESQHIAPKAGRETQLKYNYDQYAKKLGLGQYGGTWLKAIADDNLKKHGLNYTIRELIKRSNVGRNYSDQRRKALISAIMNTNGSPSRAYNWLTTSKGVYGEKHIDRNNAEFTEQERLVAMGAAFLRQRAAREKSTREVVEKYKDYPDLLVTENTNGVNTGDDYGNGNKHGGKGGRNTGSGGNPNHEKKNVAKDRANALIANIKAFYEEQMRKYLEWVAQMNADGEKISEGQQKEQMDYLQSQMERALGTARQSIATLDNGWKEFYSHMDENVMVFDDETSKQLLESIGKADIGELHKLFTKLSGDLSRENNKTLAENLGALLDQIFANGSKELREAAEKLLARQREIQKILNEHDYTGAVDRNIRSEFDRLGFLHPAKDIRVDSPEGLEKMNTAFDKLTTKARESITVLYSLNPESEKFQDQFLQFLSVANDGFDFSKLTAQNLKALYLELLKYNDEYESASKKRDDERKKLNDYGWSKTDYYKNYQKALPGAEQEVAIKGSYRNAGQRMGMESVSASDPELELMKARMEFAQQYYTFLEEHNATEQQLADARKSIMSAQANYAQKLTGDMFEQYNSLLTFMGPLQTFGESVGEAFATMTQSASKGRKALKTALKQMIKSFATNTLQMISQQQIDRAQTTAHYTQLLLMQQAFGTAKVEGEIATGTAMIGAQQANNLTEEQLEGVHQQVMAALRSAGIFGWCVSTLGPIAGPIAYGAMMSILMGLLSFAISKIGGDSSKNETVKGANTKLVTGMLTYDSGNVQDLRPFVGNDGSLYWATEDDKPHNGVSLLTQPTATTINGQPSLVAENGPELVIGRETTHAMMMNNPALLKALVNYDSNYSGRRAARRAFDNGNVGELASAMGDAAAGFTAENGNLLLGAPAANNVIANNTASQAALMQAVKTLLDRLNEPIYAKIDMYGRGNLYDSMTKANQFMKGKG